MQNHKCANPCVGTPGLFVLTLIQFIHSGITRSHTVYAATTAITTSVCHWHVMNENTPNNESERDFSA